MANQLPIENTAAHRIQVIGIASGKGGVGKTTLAVNMAVALQAMGAKVMIFDADLGLANTQLHLGCACPFNLGHVLRGEKSFHEITVTTRTGVRLIPGASGVAELAALTAVDYGHLVQSFSALSEEVDYFLVDLASGISPMVMTFLAATQRQFVVVKNEPASIADAYATIKLLVNDHKGIKDIHLIANAVESEMDGLQLFERMNQVAVRFLKQPLKFLGAVVKDDALQEACNAHQSVFEYAPHSLGARHIRQLALTLKSLPPAITVDSGLQFFFERTLKKS
jgi:flagellar biosynthesis protein FlhG